MYKYKRYEFELTPDERDRANFLLDTKRAKSAAMTLGQSPGRGPTEELEVLAFHDLKRKLYGGIRRRLGIDANTEAMTISGDGKTVIWIVAERE